ncbi:MAG: hypothetical protein ACE5KZ_08445 [Candidatus Scalinduaceae bacterium]
MINQNYLETHNFLIVTIDSLRYDVSITADIPNFKKWFVKYGTHDNFVKTYAPATYTLPSHMSMFVTGIFPENRELEGYYNRYSQSMIRTKSVEVRGKRNGINFDAPNIIQGFSSHGFKTIGIGGVGWFNSSMSTSKLLTDMFSEFYFDDLFRESNPKSLEEQIKKIKKAVNHKEKTFLFLNVSSTHFPYCDFSLNFEGQKKALEYVDQHIDEVLSFLSEDRELFCIICADHGEVFGLGGRGHGFFHPKVMEVPMMVLDTAETRKHTDTPETTSKEAEQVSGSSLEKDYYQLQEKFYKIKDQSFQLFELQERIKQFRHESQLLQQENQQLKQANQQIQKDNQQLLQDIQKVRENNQQLLYEIQQLRQSKTVLIAQKLRKYSLFLKFLSIGFNFLAKVYRMFKKG